MDAVQELEAGLTCSQAVMAVYAGCLGLERDQALGLAAGFAGGLGAGLTCGAVCAGIMVLGERLRSQGHGDLAVEMAQEFMEAFTARQGSTQCAELLAMHGLDRSTKGVGATLRALGVCRSKVRDAESIVRDMLLSC